MLCCALVFITGITIGESAWMPWRWWMVSTLVIGCLAILPRSKPNPWLLLLCVLCTGAGWSTYRLHRVDDSSLIRYIGLDEHLIRIRGRVVTTETRYDQQHRLILAVDTVLPTGSTPIVCTGRLHVRIEGGLCPEVGTRIEATGWVQRPSSHNANRDWVAYARWTSGCGWMEVPDPGLIRMLPDSSSIDVFHVTRGWVQSFTTERLGQDIDSSHIRVLMNLLITGIRTPGWKDVSEPFRRTGVSHLLAISGLHLCLFVGAILFLFRLSREPSQPQGVVIVLLVLTYLLVVQWRPPVLRAGCMLILFALGWSARRRVSSLGLLACAAVLLLLVQPGHLFLPGFQLSMLVVAMIILSTRKLHRAVLSGNVQRRGGLLPRFRSAIWSSLFVSWVAWLTASPIVLFHFQIISPYGAILSVVLIPPITLLLLLGFMRISIGSLNHTVDGFIRVMIEEVAHIVLHVVQWVDELPWSSIEVSGWPLWATFVWLAGVMFWVRFNLRDLYWSCRQWWARHRSAQTG